MKYLRRISEGFLPTTETPDPARLKTIITLIAVALLAGCASPSLTTILRTGDTT